MDMSTMKDSQSIQLPCGRTLGYAEYGDPQGEPLLFFHGFPGSRLQGLKFHKIACRLKVRLLSLDRPGFGLSTHDPKRRISDWPRDVLAFADQLGLSRFAVLGESGGGPFALVCAKVIAPERLTAVGVLAGAPQWDRGVRSEGYPWFSKLGYLGAKYVPAGMRVITSGLLNGGHTLLNTRFGQKRFENWIQGQRNARAEKGSSVAVDRASGAELPADASLLQAKHNDDGQLDRAESLAQMREELMRDIFGASFAQGTDGFVREIQLLTTEWGFEYEEIKYRSVQIWQGTRDKNVPPATVRAMAQRIPHCILRESDDTHFTIGRYNKEIIKMVMAFRDGQVTDS